ncbi:hypothetical protein [Streptomyces malaysiensis]|uniref:Uncharacterized protein n=1 Tax=Streptomyces malaysiensis subsp. samsunensis TaxID=459658 RepID=A0A9X2M207_STRMQ|nr:hypothetical protein [Streptomyces samsunensis]MCQ8833646.1 hypothetical protein [Streptomyces samsunensis]
MSDAAGGCIRPRAAVSEAEVEASVSTDLDTVRAVRRQIFSWFRTARSAGAV